jgi:hypothetical protein
MGGELKPVPIGVGGDPAERTVHVVDQVVEILACESAQATPIRQDPSGIRQPLNEPHEQLVAEDYLQVTKILGGDEGTPSPPMIAPNWSVRTSRTSLVVATLVRSIPPSWMRPSACQSSGGLLRHVPVVIPIAASFRTTEGIAGLDPDLLTQDRGDSSAIGPASDCRGYLLRVEPAPPASLECSTWDREARI